MAESQSSNVSSRPPSSMETNSSHHPSSACIIEDTRQKRREAHSPTGFTLDAKREQRLRAKQLFPTELPTEELEHVDAAVGSKWTSIETKAMLEFLLIRESVGTLPGKWGRRGDMAFWKESASFVKLRASTSYARTGWCINISTTWFIVWCVRFMPHIFLFSTLM